MRSYHHHSLNLLVEMPPHLTSYRLAIYTRTLPFYTLFTKSVAAKEIDAKWKNTICAYKIFDSHERTYLVFLTFTSYLRVKWCERFISMTKSFYSFVCCFSLLSRYLSWVQLLPVWLLETFSLCDWFVLCICVYESVWVCVSVYYLVCLIADLNAHLKTKTISRENQQINK